MAWDQLLIAEPEGPRFSAVWTSVAHDTRPGPGPLTAEQRLWLVDRNNKITPHIPVWDKSARTNGTFSRADFVFDPGRNVYICPGGAALTSSGNIDGHTVYYGASKNACSISTLKPKCTTAVVRKVTRDLDESARVHVRALANTEAFQQSRRERKKLESRFEREAHP